ncbi:MAG: DEAD/DEAH box helicase family protein [Oscillospiraceae bacterium]|nr:DEAD/DEAH box helicase family protein [Oscillospiraceae bacterium]
MTNFDFLKSEQKFTAFADAAIAAEKILNIDIAASAINCRRAMESAVKWMYSVDGDLTMSDYQTTLVLLMNSEDFREIVGIDIHRRMTLVRKVGNDAAHDSGKVTRERAELCLENLFIFLDFVACCYADEYTERVFEPALLTEVDKIPPPIVPDINFEVLINENKTLKAELTSRRNEQQQSYNPKPLDLSEYKTRKLYIDTMLIDAGWVEGKDWLNEYELSGMPNQSKTGFADYVLLGDDGKPLAVIEAKRTCADVAKGRQQAKLYADLLEQKFKRRPVIFLTNGFDTRIFNDKYEPERKVATIYSKRDLEKLFNLQTMRKSPKNITINRGIAGRYYQEAAIKAVCNTFDEKNRRKALLVMATGSGKTRTIIGLVDILLQHGWVKNVLFLADRNSLVTQAKRSFVNLLPNLSVTNLCEEKDNYSAHCVFSTYQTMMNCIDTARDKEDVKMFTSGHFDLVICDEAHRSIYNKYRDIFTYFDARLVGLTATPKDEIDKNTYNIFELENGVPTYGYDLDQAVKDGYLVNFVPAEVKLKFIEKGIIYEDLSDEDKLFYEDTFTNEDGELPERINSSALNEWVFNEDTIKKAINTLMTNGLRIDYGEKHGKTIIFAKNHDHAEKIHEIFGKEYPNLPGYTKVIDNYINYVQSAIDEFSDPKKLPQIAISVDMLDTGIDIPEILNLVFFKKVMSKTKFWQMIGRGTRLCPELLDGEDKKQFYIFDFCNNFEFFRMGQPSEVPTILALQCSIFTLKAQLAYKLQDLKFQTKDLIAFRKELVNDMVAKVKELNRENFAVRQHLRCVELYSLPENYTNLTYEDTLNIREELAPLILPDNDEVNAVRFDSLVYGIELAYIEGKKYARARSDLMKKVTAVSGIANIPEIMAQSELINKLLHTSYFEDAGIPELENIRENLRSLMKYIPKGRIKYTTNFDDDILSIDFKDSNLESDDLKNYKAKVEFYIRENQDNDVIAKLKTNVPLTSDDVKILEQILWSEIGTKDEYEAEVGAKPLGEFVREIVGLDMNSAKVAFAEYLENSSLDSRQIYFVNQIVEYIVRNGIMKDMSVMQEAPFTERGSIVEIFTDLMIWEGIRSVINKINSNSVA